MTQKMFGIERGLLIEDQVAFLVGSGAPDGVTGDQGSVGIGSQYFDYSNGGQWGKKASGTGADKWEKAISSSESGGLSWREPARVADLVSTSLPGTGTVDGVVLSVGDRVLFTNITGNKNVYVRTAGGYVEDINTETAGDQVYVQEGTNAGHTFAFSIDGDWVQAGASDSTEVGYLRSFIGKAAGGAGSPNYSSVIYITQGDNLVTALGKIDAALKVATDNLALESTARNDGDVALGLRVDGVVTALASETTARIDAITAVTDALTAETAARVAATAAEVAARDAAIAAEAAARDVAIAAASATQAAALAAELIARAAADSTEITNRDLAIAAAVAAETALRISEDLAEVTARTAAITAEASARAQAIADEATARSAAVSAEATARDANDIQQQAELDAIEAGAGLSALGNYVPVPAANYIAGATSLADADTLLDTAVKGLATAQALLGAKQTETATLLLSARKESVALNVTTAHVVDEVSCQQTEAAKWTVYIKGNAPSDVKKRRAVEVLAIHDGTQTEDALTSDFSSYATLKIGALAGLKVEVVLSGTGAAQRMQLQVTSTTAVDVYAVRERVPGLDLGVPAAGVGGDSDNWTPGDPNFLFVAGTYTPDANIVI